MDNFRFEKSVPVVETDGTNSGFDKEEEIRYLERLESQRVRRRRVSAHSTSTFKGVDLNRRASVLHDINESGVWGVLFQIFVILMIIGVIPGMALLYLDQSEEKAETKTNAESDYESEYSIYFPEKSDPELDYGSESSVYHYSPDYDGKGDTLDDLKEELKDWKIYIPRFV